MFSFLKKLKNTERPQTVFRLYSPLSGQSIPLTEVPDAVFADKILGDGAAVIPECNMLTSPADGLIDSVPDTNHAVMMTTDDGIELLMHIGIDTVDLQGKHYRALVKPGDRVSCGDPLIEFDRSAVSAAGYSVITPVIVTNSDRFRIRQVMLGQMQTGDVFLELEPKND